MGTKVDGVSAGLRIPLITRAILTLCALFAAPLSGDVAQDPLADQPFVQITFLDVGQADAVVVRAPEGQTALIDAGRDAPLGPLARLGIEQIDLLVATHPHADHIGGMTGVLNALPVRFYMDNGQTHTTATYQQLLLTLQRRTEVTYLAAEPRTMSLGSVALEVLPLPPTDAVDHNNRSVGLIVTFGAFRVFLSGDSEGYELRHFLAEGVVRDVTVLKAPHHGSDNGYTREFLEAVRPEVVVISVGDNSYGHPGPEALAAYESAAEAVYRTDYDGQVTIRGYRDGRYEVRSRGRLVREGCEGDPEGACVERLEAAPMTALLAATSASSFLGLWVFADAPGNDHQNPNGEYAVLESRASDPIDIGGWLLCDGASHCFRFPSGSVVSAGGQIVVYTGSGVSDGVAFFMNSGRAVWNNDGDTATLYDSDGTVIVRYVYE